MDNPVHKFPPPGAHPNRGCHPDKRIGTLIPMTTTETQFVGIAAADDLDFLLTADDFEPETEIDTVALDATIDAITAARELLASLETLHGHLTAGGTADATIGHTIDVHTAAERLESALVDVTVDGTFDARGTVLL